MREKNGQLMKIAQTWLPLAALVGGGIVGLIDDIINRRGLPCSRRSQPAERRSISETHLLCFPHIFLAAFTVDFPELSAYPSLILSAAMRHPHREPLSRSL